MSYSFKPIKFPKDELPHDKIIEWWYFNGFLTDEKGGRYAFMYTFFKADPRRVKLPLIQVIPVKNIYFEHSLISDLSKKKFHSAVNPVCLPFFDHNTRPLMFMHYLNKPGDVSSLTEVKPLGYHLKTKNFDLYMASTKPPLLENQTGYVRLGARRATWYYSLTNLKTEGYLKVNNKWRAVTGKSWHDHQWADAPYANDYWAWFSLQFDNEIEIVCFEYGKTRLASVMYKNCIQKTYPVKITPGTDKWISPVTGASYPQTWQIQIPQGKIEIVVKSLVKNQEIIYGLINYWEGGLAAEAKIDGKKVRGQGFAELVGFKRTKKMTYILQQKFISEFSRNWQKAKELANKGIRQII